ncbi:MAG TPA: outer membrane protein transport protein [Bryobacteraceae bacterium]|jgi:long-chain fatty acid transport protein|nr:outer membrane protein transport protein [Bryobacteraceae bacterium]
MKRLFPLSKIVFALGLTAVCSQAQDFYWNTASAHSMSMGGVYMPSSSGAIDAMTANPAGLTFLSGRTFDMSISSIFATGSFSNSVNTNSPLKDAPGVVPYGAFGMPLGHSGFSIGVGITPELTSVSNWNYVDAPGVAGASYGTQLQKSAIIAARGSVGVGYAFNRKLALGVSMGSVYNTNTFNAPYIFQQTPGIAGLKTALDLHTNGFGWNTTVGVIASPTDHFQFNMAWTSRTVVNSTGTADGNIGAQLAALGLAAQPNFHYSAAVQNVLPQSVMAGVNWRANGHWIFALQGNWVNWNSAFSSLPVALTNGTNPDINGLLGSNAINDRIPVQWKDQYSARLGVEYLLTENVSLRGGYGYSNNPVPSSTLTPLTAAVMKDHFSTGIGWRHGRWRTDLAYGIDPSTTQHVGTSSLLSGEYSNSSVRIGTQALSLDTSLQF